MATKLDTVQDAYSQIRISGLTINPGPEDVLTALTRLEDMMAEFYGRHLCLNYQFEETPDPGTEHGVDRRHHYMMATNLAVKLCPDFGKDVPQSLSGYASGAYSTSSSIAMVESLRETPYPNRMPRGEGQRRLNRWRRHFPSDPPPKTSCANTEMFYGDIVDIVESFVAYLTDEVIASYTIESSTGLTISNDVNGINQISYRASATGGGNSDTDQTVVITITTDTGRITTRERLFRLERRALTP